MSKPVDKLCDKLKKQVDEINQTMADLDDLGVEVRINYIESSPSKDVKQGISVWRLTQHINYL